MGVVFFQIFRDPVLNVPINVPKKIPIQEVTHTGTVPFAIPCPIQSRQLLSFQSIIFHNIIEDDDVCSTQRFDCQSRRFTATSRMTRLGCTRSRSTRWATSRLCRTGPHVAHLDRTHSFEKPSELNEYDVTLIYE